MASGGRERTGWRNGGFVGVLLVALGAAFWGTDGVLRVPLLEEMSPSAIVLGEHLLLLLYSVPAVLFGWRAFRGLSVSQWVGLGVIGLGGSALATLLFTLAFTVGNPTVVILLQKTQPLFAILLSGLLLRERMGWRYWLVFVVAMVGTYIVSFDDLSPFGSVGADQTLAALLAVGAALLWGSSTVLGRLILKDMSFHTLTGARLLVATPLLLVVALFQGSVGQVGAGFSARPELLILLALIPGLLGLLLYYRGLSGTRASYATLAELAFPATAVVLNWVLLDVGVTTNQLLGFVLLWASVAVLGYLNSRAPAQEDPPPALGDPGRP